MKVVLIVLVSAALALGVTSASAHEQRPKLGDSCPVLGASVVIKRCGSDLNDVCQTIHTITVG